MLIAFVVGNIFASVNSDLLAERKGTTSLELALDTYSMWYDANQALSLNKDPSAGS